MTFLPFFFFSSRRRHTRFKCDWSSDVCSSDLAGPGRELKLGGGTDSKRELLDMNLRSFTERRRNFLFGPEEVRSSGGIGVTVTFVIFRRSREMLRRGFTQSLGLIEEDDRPQ